MCELTVFSHWEFKGKEKEDGTRRCWVAFIYSNYIHIQQLFFWANINVGCSPFPGTKWIPIPLSCTLCKDFFFGNKTLIQEHQANNSELADSYFANSIRLHFLFPYIWFKFIPSCNSAIFFLDLYAFSYIQGKWNGFL